MHLRARLTYVSNDHERAIPLYRSLNEAAKRANDVVAQAECTMVLAIIEHRAGRDDRAPLPNRTRLEPGTSRA